MSVYHIIKTNHVIIVCTPHMKRKLILPSNYQRSPPPPSSLPLPSASTLSSFLIPSVLTSDVQLALHFIGAELVDGHAGVSSSVKGAWLANVQGQHSLVVPHQELGILTDDNIVLPPGDLRLRRERAKLINNQVQQIKFLEYRKTFCFFCNIV